jgi:hypothetical protein
MIGYSINKAGGRVSGCGYCIIALIGVLWPIWLVGLIISVFIAHMVFDAIARLDDPK